MGTNKIYDSIFPSIYLAKLIAFSLHFLHLKIISVKKA